VCWFVFTYQNVLAEFPTSFFYAHFGFVKFYLMLLNLSFQDFFKKQLRFGLSFCVIFCLTFQQLSSKN